MIFANGTPSRSTGAGNLRRSRDDRVRHSSRARRPGCCAMRAGLIEALNCLSVRGLNDSYRVIAAVDQQSRPFDSFVSRVGKRRLHFVPFLLFYRPGGGSSRRGFLLAERAPINRTPQFGRAVKKTRLPLHSLTLCIQKWRAVFLALSTPQTWRAQREAR